MLATLKYNIFFAATLLLRYLSLTAPHYYTLLQHTTWPGARADPILYEAKGKVDVDKRINNSLLSGFACEKDKTVL